MMGFPQPSSPKLSQHWSKWQSLLPDVSHKHFCPQKRGSISVTAEEFKVSNS